MRARTSSLVCLPPLPGCSHAVAGKISSSTENKHGSMHAHLLSLRQLSSYFFRVAEGNKNRVIGSYSTLGTSTTLMIFRALLVPLGLPFGRSKHGLRILNSQKGIHKLGAAYRDGLAFPFQRLKPLLLRRLLPTLLTKCLQHGITAFH